MTVSESIRAARPEAGSAQDQLPLWQLLAFTVAGFLAIMTENMPAGLLPQIGGGLGVSEAMAGQTVTLYALGSVVAAIPVIAATRSWNRRPLFLLAIAGLLIFNTVTAISAHYGLTLAARFIAGMSAGVVWGLVAGYARRLAQPHLQGRALAIVGVGQPIALSLGVPLGSWLGSLFDWRAVFWIMSIGTLALLAWVRSAVPDFPGQEKHERLSVGKVVAISGIRPVLAVMFAWILAHNILYTYVAPFITATGTGLRIDLILLVFGVASVVGIWGTGVLVDRYLRSLTLVSIAIFAAAMLLLAGHPSFSRVGTDRSCRVGPDVWRSADASPDSPCGLGRRARRYRTIHLRHDLQSRGGRRWAHRRPCHRQLWGCVAPLHSAAFDLHRTCLHDAGAQTRLSQRPAGKLM